MLDQTVKVAIIASMPPTIVALAALITSLFNKKGIHELHISLNSRLSELLNARGAASRSEGIAEGIQSERDRSIKS